MVKRSTIKRALISVSDKNQLVDLARELEKMGIEIISTGGTMKSLREVGIHVVAISTFTGSPEVMEGRVKTLHPKIHGGILFRRNSPEDVEQLESIDSKPIDLVIVNLYPFEQTVAKKDVTEQIAIENIDIGGPSMIRSAAKNFADVTVIVDPADYNELLAELSRNKGGTTLEFRKRCATKAFALTSRYDSAITIYLAGSAESEQFPITFAPQFIKKSALRYGENPQQQASLYADPNYSGPSLLSAEILSGKELSYNNYADLDSCLDMLLEFEKPFACIVKHANPCGVACGKSISEAYQLAYATDPLSAFGSIIGLNREVDLECAKLLHETEFIECLVAPSFSADALELLKKKKNRRFLQLSELGKSTPASRLLFKQLRGGLLVQTEDNSNVTAGQLRIVTKKQPTEKEILSLLFGDRIVKQTKSNAIVVCSGEATVGIGMGQTSRVDSVMLALKRAGKRATGATLASDAFFPMPDSIEMAVEAGISAIIQPGGSKADSIVIEAADKAGISMVFSEFRHFKH